MRERASLYKSHHTQFVTINSALSVPAFQLSSIDQHKKQQIQRWNWRDWDDDSWKKVSLIALKMRDNTFQSKVDKRQRVRELSMSGKNRNSADALSSPSSTTAKAKTAEKSWVASPLNNHLLSITFKHKKGNSVSTECVCYFSTQTVGTSGDDQWCTTWPRNERCSAVVVEHWRLATGAAAAASTALSIFTQCHPHQHHHKWHHQHHQVRWVMMTTTTGHTCVVTSKVVINTVSAVLTQVEAAFEWERW